MGEWLNITDSLSAPGSRACRCGISSYLQGSVFWADRIRKKRTNLNLIALHWGRLCYRSPGVPGGTGQRKVPVVRQKAGAKSSEWRRGSGKRELCELLPMCVLRDRCRGPATDSMWGWGGWGGRTCWINTFGPLLPPWFPLQMKTSVDIQYRFIR